MLLPLSFAKYSSLAYYYLYIINDYTNEGMVSHITSTRAFTMVNIVLPMYFDIHYGLTYKNNFKHSTWIVGTYECPLSKTIGNVLLLRF